MVQHLCRILIGVAAAAAIDTSNALAHPDLWHWMDSLAPEAVTVTVTESEDSASTLAILDQPGHRIVLELSRIELTDSASLAAGVSAAKLYRGVVRGEAESQVAVSIAAGRFGASVRVAGELIFVDAPDGDSPADGLLYRGDDPLAGPSLLKDTDSAVRAGGETVFVLDVAAVADFEYFQKFGVGTEAQMLAVLNLVDAIYLEQIDVTLDISFTQVFDKMADPFSAFNSANLFNNYRDATTEFGGVRDAAGGAFEAAGLAHLFSDRNLNVPMGGKINAGFAFIDTLCDADRGVSISTAPTVGTSLHALVVAHEFGHNFGSPHDSEGSCAATPAGQFIMSPSATGNAFSNCSKNIMTTNRDEASCIDETTATTTTTLPPALCGDATGDGSLLASDALRVLRVGVGQLSCLPCICDTDGSGTISAADALLVLRVSVNQPVDLFCPAC